MRFAPPLEEQYRRSRLLKNRTLIRVASLFALVLIAFRCGELAYEGVLSERLALVFSLTTVCSIILALIAWGPRFERLYPRWGGLIIPARNSIIAVQVASVVAHGQPEMLMVLPITLIGPFFFLGLPLRASFVCCAVTAATYAVCAALLGLPGPMVLRTDMLLLWGILACVIAVWNLEKTARLSFLEGGLLTELAERDCLTGTKNRRVFDEHLVRIWSQAIEQGRAIALLLIDVDHFKAYNDRYGHQAGDQTLRRVAQVMQQHVHRPLDLLVRYGGEEFVTIAYDVDHVAAREMAERICRAVADMNIEHRGARNHRRVTISVGVAAIRPSAERTPHGALQLADQALYEAKVQGRNRVAMKNDTHHSLVSTGIFAVTPDVLPAANG